LERDHKQHNTGLVVRGLLIVVLVCAFALSISQLSGCATAANAEQTEDVLDDANSRAANDKAIYTEQLELKKAELEQKELELQSAEGMLNALIGEVHPDEALVATYENLVATIKEDIETLKADIAWLEEQLVELDKQLGGSADSPPAASEDDPLGDLLPQDEQDAQNAQDEQSGQDAQNEQNGEVQGGVEQDEAEAQ
jgi:chromosome segregation ATPase